ncbi:MAG: DUF1549 domain-containing protein [Limisphaerales bacterium]
MRCRSLFGGFVFIALVARASDTIEILPRKITLHGQAAHQRLIAEKVQGKQHVGEITNAVFVSNNPKVVKVENGVAIPVGNGKATVSLKGGKASVGISVEGMDKPFEWSFRNHVQPVLAKAGCSAGACHGAAAGQNGFKLSLRGYDNEGDFLTLTRSALGRRVIPSDPGRSLMLLKPTSAVPHKGGKRFEVDSIDYRVIADWIASGTPGPKPEDPRIEKIEIIPSAVVLKNGDAQQLMVVASFSGGHTEDVTHWAKFNAANGSVTQVDDEGRVRVIGNGEGAITAWYLSRIAAATVTAPFTNQIPSRVFTQAKRRNFIDDLVNEKLRSLNIPPSAKCTDAEFVRRAYLDTIGVLPTEKETRDFLADKSSKKRDQLIDRLLQRPEFVDYWSHKWSDLLLVSTKKLKPAAMWSYYNWIRENVTANTHWDEFARKIVTATGSTFQNGAGNFYVLHDDPKSLAETTSQAFLGMSVACAKCHNHPMEKWTNDQYYKFANLYARVRAKSGNGEGEAVVYTVPDGDLVQPLTGKPQVPTPLDGTPVAIDSPEDRRNHLADWLVSRDNPYFARAIVNRVWANYFGVGIVEAVDDLRVTNPASNEKLLSATAKFLADQKFDLKVLMRTIMQSETYQRSSEPLPENVADTRFYSRYYPRRLMAEVLLDAVSQVTDTYDSATFTGSTADFGGQAVPFPKGWRAMQLPDTRVDSYFLKTFGRPDRTITCECERTADASVSQVLHVCNGDTINKKLEAKNNEISKLLSKKTPPQTMLDHAYLSALSRYPTEPEKKKLIAALETTKPEEVRPVVEDIYWALLSSREFLFNH